MWEEIKQLLKATYSNVMTVQRVPFRLSEYQQAVRATGMPVPQQRVTTFEVRNDGSYIATTRQRYTQISRSGYAKKPSPT